MIVPEFKLKQNQSHVQIYIRVPYIKVNACEFYIQKNVFKFYLKPYLLSLTFQQNLRETEEPSKATYYHQKYILEVHLEKENKGEVFQNLDLLANVVNNKKTKKKNKVNVEVIGEGGKVVVEEDSTEVCQFNYGFAMNYSNVLDHLDQQAAELFQFHPKNIPLSARFGMSNQILVKEFDFESYLFDKYDNKEEIQCILMDKSFLEHMQGKASKQGKQINSTEYKIRMSGKQLLISKKYQQNLLREITSLAFSYIYEMLCMTGDFSIQSAKTINKTSLILSCNCYYHDIPAKEMVINCGKRCITYSLYKSLLICQKTIDYLEQLLEVGILIGILLEIKEAFDKNQPRYLLNQLYINDYLTYLYSLKGNPKQLQILKKQLSGIKIEEKDLQLGIEEYEKMEDGSSSQEYNQADKKETAQLEKEFSNLNTLD